MKRIMFASNDPSVSSSGGTGPLSSNLYKVSASGKQGVQEAGFLHPYPTQHLFSSESATSESLRSEKPSKTIQPRRFLLIDSTAAEHRQRLQELGALLVDYSEYPWMAWVIFYTLWVQYNEILVTWQISSGATVKSVTCCRFTCLQGDWFASLLETAASSKVTAAPSKHLLCLFNYAIFYLLFRKELLHCGSLASQENYTSIMDEAQDKKHREF